MTPLWLAVVALLLLVLGCLLVPLLGAEGGPAQEEDERLRALHASRLAELQRDLGAAALPAGDGSRAREDAQRLVLEDLRQASAAPRDSRWLRWAPAAVFSVLLPVAAVVLYLQVGDPQAAASQVLASRTDMAHEGGDDAAVAAMVTRLAQRLQQQPDDVAGWVMLARSYDVMEKHQAAVTAYRKALALAPGEAQLLADFADALASAQGGHLEGEPRTAFEAALAIDPQHPKALALAAAAASRRGDPADAPGAVAGPAAISGQVSIAPELRDRARPGDTLFVVARAAGARQPVAVLRVPVAALPAAFLLDDRHAMTPGQSLARQPAMTIEARISRSGNALRQPGDLVGTTSDAAPGRHDLRIVVDQVVP